MRENDTTGASTTKDATATFDELWWKQSQDSIISGRTAAGRCNDEHCREVHRLSRAGLTYAEIGRRCGISRERVRQFVTVNPPRRKFDLMSLPTLTPGEVPRPPFPARRCAHLPHGWRRTKYTQQWRREFTVKCGSE